MSNMIKIVAQAICAAYGDVYDEQPADLNTLRAERARQGMEVRPHDTGLPTQADWDDCARAAFDTIEEPTPEMIEAGFDVLIRSCITEGTLETDKLWIVEIYKAMICRARIPTSSA